MAFTARIFDEIQIEFEGYYDEGDPSVGLSDGFIAEEIVGLTTMVRGWNKEKKDFETKRVNLLEGVDMRSKDVQRLLSNWFNTLDPGTLSEALSENYDGGQP